MVTAVLAPSGHGRCQSAPAILDLTHTRNPLPSPRRRIHPLALPVALLASLLAVAPAVGANPDPSPAPGLTSPVTFYGRGWGHGVGMSQYGARGRALAGQDAATILAHYYPGTTLATVDAARPVRVLIAAAHRPTTTRPVRVIGRRGAWTIDGVARTFPVDAAASLTRRLTAAGTYAWRLRVKRSDGTLLYTAPSPKSVRIRPAAVAATRFQVGFKATTSDTYRGVVRLLPKPNGTVAAVNERRAGRLPPRRRAGRDAVDLAGRGTQRAGRRGSQLCRAAPASGDRLASTCTTTRGPRSTAASAPSERRRTLPSPRRPARSSRAARSSPARSSTRRRGCDREQRERVDVGDGSASGRLSHTCAAHPTGPLTGRPTTRPRPMRRGRPRATRSRRCRRSSRPTHGRTSGR